MKDIIEKIENAYERRKETSVGKYSYFDPAWFFIVQQREKMLVNLIKKHRMQPLAGKRILDVGCGDGAWLRDMLRYGADADKLFGVELLGDRVAQAKLLSPNLSIVQDNAEKLKFDDEHFDIVLQSTMFTSIPDFQMRQNIANEMIRVLKPGGIIIWYDFRFDNPNNPDVRGIKKKQIMNLFHECDFDFTRVTLAPPIARKTAPRWLSLCYVLDRIPILRTHYFVVISKRSRLSEK